MEGGLDRVEQLAREMHGAPSSRPRPSSGSPSSSAWRRDEDDPKAPEERFFVELKRATTRAYYSSQVGMIDDIEYKGNRVIREFAGTDVSKA